MKGSPKLLEASSFRTIEELDTFLCNHSISIPDLDFQSDKSTSNEILISVNEEILTALLSLESAVISSPKKDSVSKKHFTGRNFPST